MYALLALLLLVSGTACSTERRVPFPKAAAGVGGGAQPSHLTIRSIGAEGAYSVTAERDDQAGTPLNTIDSVGSATIDKQLSNGAFRQLLHFAGTIRRPAAAANLSLAVDTSTGAGAELSYFVDRALVADVQLRGAADASVAVSCHLCEHIISPLAAIDTGRLATPHFEFSRREDEHATHILSDGTTSSLPSLPLFVFKGRRYTFGVAVRLRYSSNDQYQVTVDKVGLSSWRVEVQPRRDVVMPDPPKGDFSLLVLPGPLPDDVRRQYLAATRGPGKLPGLWAWDPLASMALDGEMHFTAEHDEVIALAEMPIPSATEQRHLVNTSMHKHGRALIASHGMTANQNETDTITATFDAELQSLRSSATGRRHEFGGPPPQPHHQRLRVVDDSATDHLHVRGFSTTLAPVVGPQRSAAHLLIPVRTEAIVEANRRLDHAWDLCLQHARSSAIVALHRPDETNGIREKLRADSIAIFDDARRPPVAETAHADAKGMWWRGLRGIVAELSMFAAFGATHLGVEPTAMAGPPPCDGELLARMVQLASVLPLARYPASCVEEKTRRTVGAFEFLLAEHNDLQRGGPTTALLAARYALRLRQKLLPYYYSESVRAHLSGKAFVRPLYGEWPAHPLWTSRHETILLGDALIARPIVEHNPMRVLVSTPDLEERWYTFHNGRETTSNVIETMTSADLSEGMPMALRGGRIVPLLATRKSNAMGTRHDPIHLVVSLGAHNTSAGLLYFDDGTGQKALFHSGKYVFIEASYRFGKLTLTPLVKCPRNAAAGTMECAERKRHWSPAREISKITINGLNARVRGVSVEATNDADEAAPVLPRASFKSLGKGQSLVVTRPGIRLDGVSSFAVAVDCAFRWS